ncbi:hypothetical protein [Lentibacillus sp. CBA3610]|uniref:hypothetical protein n=1 Tax=Lentibacillus sp. CBA3610 TaxID=2518176 RepID=UPI0015963B93|nr:hypothetical protein [Lentibacillus sp. CBA3610]
MDEIMLLTATIGLVTAFVGFVTEIVTTYRGLCRRKESNSAPTGEGFKKLTTRLRG